MGGTTKSNIGIFLLNLVVLAMILTCMFVPYWYVYKTIVGEIRIGLLKAQLAGGGSKIDVDGIVSLQFLQYGFIYGEFLSSN
jgi:hypothetical protein